MFSMMCANRETLFQVEAEKPWQCIFDESGYKRLEYLIRQGSTPGPLGGASCEEKLIGPVTATIGGG